MYPFLECHHVSGHFRGCYRYCKSPDYGAHYTANNDEDNDSDSDSSVKSTGGRVIDGPGSQAAPIVVDLNWVRTKLSYVFV